MTALQFDNLALSALTTAAALTSGRHVVLIHAAGQQGTGRWAQQSVTHQSRLSSELTEDETLRHQQMLNFLTSSLIPGHC